MNCKVEKSRLNGTITCPPNKSYTHRAIFLASLANGESTIKNILHSRDTNATIEICKKFGAEIRGEQNNLVVSGVDKFGTADLAADASNSGTTIRIAAAVAALREGKTTLTGDESLRKRPMKPLLDALESLGAKCSSNGGKPPLTISGRMRGGEVSIPGNVSSQFISALLIASPLTEKGVTLGISSDLVSKPYLDATIIAMAKFGAKVNVLEQYKKYKIEPQQYQRATITIPSDFSSVALLLSAAVLVGHDFSVNVSVGDLAQGDEAIIDMLGKLGVEVSMDNGVIAVKSPEKLRGGRFNLSNNPDLLPPLSILALKSDSPIELYNVRHARFKETDRIAILARELQKLGIIVTEKEDGLILVPPKELRGASLNSENDHRLFMAFCIAAMHVGGCTVSDSDSVDVSYPSFVSDMNRAGARISIH